MIFCSSNTLSSIDCLLWVVYVDYSIVIGHHTFDRVNQQNHVKLLMPEDQEVQVEFFSTSA